MIFGFLNLIIFIYIFFKMKSVLFNDVFNLNLEWVVFIKYDGVLEGGIYYEELELCYEL